ncbi:response regulator, partial [bacterium]|nr:response regulator [candidate division CSSED10-310 bacterium]
AMIDQNNRSDDTLSPLASSGPDLRQRAEALARERAVRAAENGAALSPEEIRKTLHELRVHQIELEMQNEELRAAHVEIEAGRARYFDLYDLAPVGYCTLSDHGLILEANLTAATLLDWRRGDLIKQPITRFILQEDQDIYYLHRKKLIEAHSTGSTSSTWTGEPRECELRLVKPDGTCFWAHLSSTITQAEDGTPMCHCVISNIAKRKQAEADREKLEAQLRQAQKMEAIGRLAGGVAHDLNNMLGIIIGYADLLLEEVDPDQPFHADLLEIRKAGARSADLTRQLLAFARKQTVDPKVLNLNEAVDGMLNMLHQLIGEDIDMTWIPEENLWPVKIDPGQIDQVLANLSVNARDAIAGTGKVTIETGNTVFDEAFCRDHVGFVPGEYAMLAVSDNGCGMDSETMSHLFEPFYTTKEQGMGTGLGLAMVYGVVKQNNGFVIAFSEPGQGTTFKIYLPRHLTPKLPLQEKKLDKPSERGHETVLLVEDEPVILKMTTMMLEGAGYTVVAAGTPGDAIRLSNEHVGDIHLLISDVIMPEMNGRDLAQKILSLYPRLKCLFMSGFTANVIAHQGVLEEGVNFIQKPFSRTDLVIKAREVLDNEKEETTIR